MLLSKTSIEDETALLESKHLGRKALWFLRIFHREEKIYKGIIDWQSYPLSSLQCVNAQALLLDWWGEDAVNNLKNLTENEYRKADILLRLMVLAESLYPNQKYREYTKLEWINVATLTLFHVWEDKDNTVRQLVQLKNPLSKQHLERVISVLKAWHSSYQLGSASDGPEYVMTKPVIEKKVKQEFKQLGFCFDTWKKGGTYGSVPFIIAHLLLADALQILHSESTKQLLIFFETVRDHNAYSLIKTFWNSPKNTQLGVFKLTGAVDHFCVTSEGQVADGMANRTKFEFATILNKKLRQASNCETEFTFPWKTYYEFRDSYIETQTAIYVIFLSIMGKRGPSEVSTLRAIDISASVESTGQDATMRPSIEKTNFGLREEQGVSNFVDQSFKTLLKLGYFDKTNTEYGLFTSLPVLSDVSKPPTQISDAHLAFYLQNFYEQFVKRTQERIDFDIFKLHRNVSSHQFRHSFAEFALRRFDGNVEELLRQHYCHSHNHWWTKRYTADKLDSKRIELLNRNYIRELVPRILQDHPESPDFVGPMALFIKKHTAEKIKVLSPKETESYLEELCSAFIQVTPHEYGWCLLHDKYRSVAKCIDSTATPRPDNTSSEKCNSCMNFCSSRSSHLEKQTQIAMNHIDFIEQKIWSMQSLKNASINAVRDAQKLFPELKKLGNM